MEHIQGLMQFIEASPTAFHAVDNLKVMLDAEGFTALNEGAPWRLAPGGKYYFTRNLSSVIAFRLPEGAPDHFQIIASHADSPCFRLKPNPGRTQQGFAALNVEGYGGMLMQTWFDRPLTVAGRLIVRTETGYRTALVNIDRDLAVIPNMPIHFNRDANDGVKLNPQVDMLPVYGCEDADILALAAERAGVAREDIAGCDLFLVSRDAPRLWGANDEFILSPRLDDLECAYTSAAAFLRAAPSRHVDVLCVFDNEEVGSGTKQGADSSMLTDAISRIAAVFGMPPEAATAKSFLLSADNAHGVHPNHPEKYDDENRAKLNGGVVVKFNAAQKYTSDGVSQAVFEGICAHAGVPVQRFANRSDVRGGSTLGNIAVTHASMNAVDIGLAQWAMHSANESAGVKDVDHMVRAMKAFYEAEIAVEEDGVIRVEAK
ncbi:MAG: M18 family aminopeptidase [Clostridiales bacterium]|nr:M18 family aminopeptidase [Clostridiales bacterium]